jgi:CotH kinase protein/Lamin Tail Domain
MKNGLPTGGQLSEKRGTAVKVLLALCAALILVLPSSAAAAVVINEIMYHPDSEIYDASWEFVELYNTDSSSIDISGWYFSNGITFTFAPGTEIPGYGYLVVANDAAEAASHYSISNVVGNFGARLSDGGERLSISDASGTLVDTVRYDDKGSWPVAPDGQGPSLECLNPFEDNDTPANWRAASGGSSIGTWRPFEIQGNGSDTGTRSSVYLYLDGPGECLLDNLEVVNTATPANHLKWGDFESPDLALGTTDGWRGTGNHAGSYLSNDTVFGGTCVRVVSTGIGGSDNNSFQQYNMLIDVMEPEPGYTIRGWVKFLTPGLSMEVRFTGSGTIGVIDSDQTADFSPGGANSRSYPNLPPLVEYAEVVPVVPQPDEDAVILASISDADGIAYATLEYEVVDGAGGTLAMLDDGLHSDGVAGDSIFGVTMPRQANETITRYLIWAEDNVGTLQLHPESSEPTPNSAYFTWDGSPETQLRIVWLYCDASSWSSMSKYNEVSSIIVVDGIVYDRTRTRWRGNTAISNYKKNFKFRFNKDNRARDKKTWNLNGDMVDKSYMHSAVSWEICKRVGVPYAETESHHLRVRPGAGGFTFWGLYVYLEQFNEQFLDRVGLDDGGNLYKSASDQRAYTSYSSRYRKNTNEEANDWSDLEDFIAGINVYYTAQPQVSKEQAHLYLLANMNIDEYLDYLCSMTLIGNADQCGKNQFVYHNPDDNRWMKFPWDLDLTMGNNYDNTISGGFGFRLLNNTYKIDNHILMGCRQHPKNDGPWNKITDRFVTEKDSASLTSYNDPYAEEFRLAYLARLRTHLDNTYVPSELHQYVDDYKANINSDALLDAQRWVGAPRSDRPGDWILPGDFDRDVQRIKDFISARRDYLYNQIALVPGVPTRTPTPVATPTATPTPSNNSAPRWFAPEVLLLQAGSGSNSNILQLTNHVVDDLTPNNELIFQLVSQSAPGIVNVSVSTSGTVSAYVLASSAGVNSIVVAVEDGGGLIAWTTIKVHIIGNTSVPEKEWNKYR